MKKVLVICGPTASGKTALSLRLAERFDGEIVCADSMQVYRGLDIATAKPTARERAAIPHHMLDIVDPWEPYSAAAYQRDARACVADIHARGKLPIVCGGTGLFIDALTCPMDFMRTRGGPETRRGWEALLEREGKTALHAALAARDPETAARLHPNDARRVIRALEVIDATGEAPRRVDYRAQPVYELDMLGIAWTREALYARIETRVAQMMGEGLLEEARAVHEMALPEGATALQGIGYKEFFPFIRGERDLPSCVEALARNTRRYAKRQLTWFRGDARVRWIDGERLDGDWFDPQYFPAHSPWLACTNATESVIMANIDNS